MTTSPESGFLVIADLSGYTAYLSGSELEHAPAIAGDLLETIVGRLDPPFRLAKFEGDAAFLYVEDGRADGPLLLDAVEACYLAFRRRLRSIDQATSCECNSCRLAPRLDLKLFVHHGSYVRTRIAGRDELAGSDVILVHRLLKGEGARAAHGNGFALFTMAAVDALGLDPGALGLTAAEELIEHLGTVATATLDLEARWQAETGSRRLEIAGQDLLVDIDLTVPAEPAVAWAYLTAPALRGLWEGPLVIEETLVGGRRGVGSRAQCVSGRLATLEEIVDWQPYDHVGWRLAVPDVGPVLATSDLEATGDATRIRLRWEAPAGVGPRCRRDRPHPGGQGGGVRPPRTGRRRRVAGAGLTGERLMIRFAAEQTIERSADDVWSYAADIVRHPEWMGVTDARIIRGAGTEVGARAIERAKFGPRSADVEFEVSASIPSRRIAWTVAGGGPVAGAVALDLEPIAPDRTRAVWSGSLGLTGLWRVLEPLMASEIRSGEAAELERLKRNLEATHSPVGALAGRA